MLQLKAVYPETFSLLEELSGNDPLRNFFLAGGTALALYLGHRISVDLDLFTDLKFDSNALFEDLKRSYSITSCSLSTNSLGMFIQTKKNDVKVDFIRHSYPLLNPVQHFGDIRLFSIEDLAAMKLNAIANRGAKKDFFDIVALLDHFSLPQLLQFFEEKYTQLNCFTVLKSLIYFDDADLEPDPISLRDMRWDNIKDVILQQVKSL